MPFFLSSLGTSNPFLSLLPRYISTLVNEMLTATTQLMMMAKTGRTQHMPTLNTVEAIMKLSPTMVQALWETQNPVLQLPHFDEQKLRCECVSNCGGGAVGIYVISHKLRWEPM